MFEFLGCWASPRLWTPEEVCPNSFTPQIWFDCHLNIKTNYLLFMYLVWIYSYLIELVRTKLNGTICILSTNQGTVNFHYAVLLNGLGLFVLLCFTFITTFYIVFYLLLIFFLTLLCWKDLKAVLLGPGKQKSFFHSVLLFHAIMNKEQNNSKILVKNYRKIKFCLS